MCFRTTFSAHKVQHGWLKAEPQSLWTLSALLSYLASDFIHNNIISIIKEHATHGMAQSPLQRGASDSGWKFMLLFIPRVWFRLLWGMKWSAQWFSVKMKEKVWTIQTLNMETDSLCVLDDIDGGSNSQSFLWHMGDISVCGRCQWQLSGCHGD